MITWYMVVGRLIIILALGHQNKGKASFTGSGLFVLMSTLTTSEIKLGFNPIGQSDMKSCVVQIMRYLSLVPVDFSSER